MPNEADTPQARSPETDDTDRTGDGAGAGGGTRLALEADWESTVAVLEQERKQVKSFFMDDIDGKGGFWHFRYRQISDAEDKKIRDKCVKRVMAAGRKPEVRVDEDRLAGEMIKTATVEGPPGMPVPMSDIAVSCIPRKLRNRYLEAIDDFSSMPEEARVSFRDVGEGDED